MKKLVLAALLAAAVMAIGAAPALADHSWGSYHWAQALKSDTSAPSVSVTLGDNLVQSRSTNWPVIFKGISGAELGDAGSVVNDWSYLNPTYDTAYPDILNTPWTTGANTTSQKRCKAKSGRVEVCNARYGYNGWLGLAQIWTSGGHIAQGTAKVNDSYLDSSSYNDVARQHVLCQEVGHTFGLDHQDEDGFDLDTCMDYADSFDNAHPNAHDNEQIWLVYTSHTDSTSTTSSAPTGKGKVRRLREDLYVEEFPNGAKKFTFVTWKDSATARRAPSDRAPE